MRQEEQIQFQDIVVEASWKKMHTVYTDMQIAFANETQREESAKSKIQEEHEKCVKALPESIQ